MPKTIKAKKMIELSMFGPAPWVAGYDVAARMDELEHFWNAGVTPALYDAMKHAEQKGEVPDWVFAGALKVVKDRLAAGFETQTALGKRKDEKKIYRAEVRDYYRWRAVWKNRPPESETWDDAYAKASDELAGTFAKGKIEIYPVHPPGAENPWVKLYENCL